MSDASERLIQKITSFGISQQAAEVYVSLAQSGPAGIMDIARRASIGRNVAYRLLDELESAQLVSVLTKSFGKVYTTNGIDAFEAAVNNQQLMAEQMRTSLTDIAAGLQALSPNPKSQIIHFSGLAGLKQVNWNLTKAVDEYRVYEQSHLNEYLPTEFADSIGEKYVEHDLTSYDLTNKTVVHNPDGRYPMDYWLKRIKYRYLPRDVLDIQYEMYIYNDVVTLLDYADKNKQHCIEIHNARLAKMQKQIYDAVWSQAQEFALDPETGARKLK